MKNPESGDVQAEMTSWQIFAVYFYNIWYIILPLKADKKEALLLRRAAPPRKCPQKLPDRRESKGIAGKAKKVR